MKYALMLWVLINPPTETSVLAVYKYQSDCEYIADKLNAELNEPIKRFKLYCKPVINV